jgi:endonuclease/exonuclease/phosphatase family metal-dependent hydrolase
MEVENSGVLDSLRKAALSKSGYTVAAFSPAPGQAVGCAILSRLPLVGIHAHGIAVGKAQGRHLLEAEFDFKGERLVVFVCHWKSKLGGSEATEAERREDAALLADRASALIAADPDVELLACGDFNESPDEFRRVGRLYPTALFPAGESRPSTAGGRASCIFVAAEPGAAGLGPAGLCLYSPWIRAQGYSYMSKGEEERIDGFLLAPGLLDAKGLSLADFHVLSADFLVDEVGKPRGYNSLRGQGYSDHLPVILELSPGPG